MYTLRNTLRTRLNWTNSKIFGGCWSRCGWFWLWEEVILQLVVWWRGRVRVWVWGLGSECCQGKVPHIGLSTSVCTGVVYNTVDYFATLCGMSPGIAMLVSQSGAKDPTTLHQHSWSLWILFSALIPFSMNSTLAFLFAMNFEHKLSMHVHLFSSKSTASDHLVSSHVSNWLEEMSLYICSQSVWRGFVANYN